MPHICMDEVFALLVAIPLLRAAWVRVQCFFNHNHHKEVP